MADPRVAGAAACSAQPILRFTSTIRPVERRAGYAATGSGVGVAASWSAATKSRLRTRTSPPIAPITATTRGDQDDLVERAREGRVEGALDAWRRAGWSDRASRVVLPEAKLLASCPCVACSAAAASPCARRPASVLAETWCWKIAPSDATPVAIPTWRNVLLIPDAIPERFAGTTLTAVDASAGLTIPIPTPPTMKPASRCVQVESAWSPPSGRARRRRARARRRGSGGPGCGP